MSYFDLRHNLSIKLLEFFGEPNALMMALTGTLINIIFVGFVCWVVMKIIYPLIHNIVKKDYEKNMDEFVVDALNSMLDGGQTTQSRKAKRFCMIYIYPYLFVFSYMVLAFSSFGKLIAEGPFWYFDFVVVLVGTGVVAIIDKKFLKKFLK